ncbi:hypothetical protein AYO47_03890 [Planctomyces sp. SCGC AG-212-M04]|nr:hypothetical protein AYO47_03890 [Planctomyces sp. SCGC AG-212-M04]
MATYLYCRVSSEAQAQSGAGEGAQLHDMRSHLARLGEREAAVFYDRAECRETSPLDRPGFRSLMAVVKRGDTIVCKTWDRLGTILEVPTLLQSLAKRGINIQVCQGGDATTDEGQLLTHVLLSVSQFELLKIRRRTRDALAERRRQGRRDTRRRYGFKAVDGQFVPEETEQKVIEEIRDAVEMGETLRSIAADLEARGVPAPEAGSKWHPSTLSRLLRRIHQTATSDILSRPSGTLSELAS